MCFVSYSELDSLSEEKAQKKFVKKFVKKYNKRKLAEIYYAKYYPPAPTTGDVTILLFYAYCPVAMTRGKVQSLWS